MVEETGVPWENQGPAASHWQTLSHNVESIINKSCMTRQIGFIKEATILMKISWVNFPYIKILKAILNFMM